MAVELLLEAEVSLVGVATEALRGLAGLRLRRERVVCSESSI